MSEGQTEGEEDGGELGGEIWRPGQLASLCQFVQTEEARVALAGQVTGDLADHAY